jgi:hypothetical protein
MSPERTLRVASIVRVKAIGRGSADVTDATVAYADLGEVLTLAGRADEGAAAFVEALARYER